MEARWLLSALSVLALSAGPVLAEETQSPPETTAPVAAPADSGAGKQTDKPAGTGDGPGARGTPVRLAQGPTPPPPAAPPVEQAAPKPKKWTFGGSADFYFSTNFNNPFTGLNVLGYYDLQDEGGPHLNLAELWVQKNRDPIGFRLDLNWGPSGRLTNFGERLLSGDDIWDHVQQAFVSVNLNRKGNTYLDFGRWVTPIGAEVIEPGGNWLYSRAMYFAFGGPFTHTGARLFHYFNDTDYVMFNVHRGWDVVSDPGQGISFGLTYSKVLSPKWTATANYMTGPEFDSNGRRSSRNLFDFVGVYTMNDRWAFTVNTDFATQSGDSWYGISGMAKYSFHPKQYVAARLEFMKDTDGFRFGQPGSTTAFGLTLGYAYTFNKHFQTRLEFRHDFSDRNLFPEDRVGQFTGSQSRFLISGLLSF